VWNTHLRYGKALGQMLTDFRDQYLTSVDLLAEETSTDRNREVNRHLAEHLAVFYWQGFLDWGSEDRLLERFFDKASLDLRRHMIDFIGRSLNGWEDVPTEPLVRLRDLIDRRILSLNGMTRAEKRKEAHELTSFGWWFATNLFEDQWAVRTLRSIVLLAGEIEPGHMVAERLCEMASLHPADVADTLYQMVVGAEESYRIGAWAEDARRIVERLLESADSSARRRATDIINAFLDRGYNNFRSVHEG
jgi:hypothetical protein